MPRNQLFTKIFSFFQSRKKLVIVGIIFFLFVGTFSYQRFFRNTEKSNTPPSEMTQIQRSFEFPALNSQGKQTREKVKLTISTVEKTYQVLVNDKTFTAKNNKLFLIVNLEYRNDETDHLNIFPGDLIRLSYGDDKETRFAPDLHNNLVPVAAISTKIDRIGFVIPDNEKQFTLYIGELEEKKEEVEVRFQS